MTSSPLSAPSQAPASRIHPSPRAGRDRSRQSPLATLLRQWPLLVATVGIAFVAYAAWARGGDAVSWPFTVVGVVAYVGFLALCRAQTTPAVGASARTRGPGVTRRSA